MNDSDRHLIVPLLDGAPPPAEQADVCPRFAISELGSAASWRRG